MANQDRIIAEERRALMKLMDEGHYAIPKRH